jgi:hypothetical protein
MTSAFAKQILQGMAGPAGAVDNAIFRSDGVTGSFGLMGLQARRLKAPMQPLTMPVILFLVQ